MLNIYSLEDKVTTLGPYSRFCVWVQGCNRRCKGCVSDNSQNGDKGTQYDTGALAWDIICSDKGNEGLTISGGEPFLQAEELCKLIDLVKQKRDMGVIIYTGYLKEEIPSLPFGEELLSRCDLLIDGPYIQEKDDSKSLRGSSNQKVYALTDRYKDKLDLYGTKERKTELRVHSDGFSVVGVPNRKG